MCQETSDSGEPAEAFRVTGETYQMLSSNYTDQYSCNVEQVETNVCVCPSGYMDVRCDTV